MANCANCGEHIGPGPNLHREPESCGNPECYREVRDMYRQMESDARQSAAEDNFDRYRY